MQAKFESVEIKPQAIEWAFCLASNFKFNVSADNLNGAEVDRFSFQQKVQQQALQYLQQGFPIRAQQFIDALIAFYQPGFVLTPTNFEVCLAHLDTKSALEPRDAAIIHQRAEEVVHETI